ncbi:MAG: 7TM-DISM domain-containing protein, partial [Clostridium sp.]|nr:7TM-DISM domain-containing protein [Clostridium sp.]
MKNHRFTKDHIRFLVVLPILLAICAAVFFAIAIPRGSSSRRAILGSMDLTNEDLSEKIAFLDGEWEFYHGELYGPTLPTDAKEPDYVTVPASWDLMGYPLFGYGTYRLTLTSDEKRLMLLVPEIPDSALIYINGEEVFRAGRVGTNASEFTSKIRNAFVTFEPVNGQAEILIQVSNYTWVESGLRYRLEVGRPEVLLDDGMFRRVCVGVFAGMLLMMGLYHVILFFANRIYKAYLYFALLCIATAFRFCVETNGLFQFFWDGGVSDFMFHIYITMMPVVIWVMLLFTREVFEIPKPKRFQRVFFTAILAGITIISIFVPYHLTGVEYIFFSLIPLVWTVVSAMKSPNIRKNPYLWLYLIAFVIYMFWGYLTKVIWQDELYMPGIASNLFMVMGQFVILAADYSSV